MLHNDHPALGPVRRPWTALALVGLSVLVVVLAAISPTGAAAQGTSANPEQLEDEESLASKLSVHGFLSLGWGITDGNQNLGLTEDGTAEYRSAALQLRFTATEWDSIVFQTSHERLGESVLNEHLKTADCGRRIRYPVRPRSPPPPATAS